MILYSVEDRFPVPIESIVRPEHLFLVPTHYADFAGLAKKYAPRSILELGVKFGYGACAMILGALAGGEPCPFYVGVDNEADEPGTNEIAQTNILRLCPRAHQVVIKADLAKPVDLSRTAPFDLISVDTLHTRDGVLSLCRIAWPLLTRNGIMVVDDLDNPEVKDGAVAFLARLEDREEPHQAQFFKSARDWLVLRKSA